MAKRNQKPEVRKAQREQAIRAAKEAKKTTKVTIAAATLKLAGIKVVPIKYFFLYISESCVQSMQAKYTNNHPLIAGCS